MKWLVLFAFALILSSLGSALFYLVRDKGRSAHVVRALTFRITFSVLLFLMILLAHYLGWIEPTGLPLR
ncbi:MAG: twin transmembrane helix small protein [Burkholderiaceae bacterium]